MSWYYLLRNRRFRVDNTPGLLQSRLASTAFAIVTLTQQQDLVLALSEICRHISDSGGFRLSGRTRELVHGRQVGSGQPLSCGDQPVANSVPPSRRGPVAAVGCPLAVSAVSGCVPV